MIPLDISVFIFAPFPPRQGEDRRVADSQRIPRVTKANFGEFLL